MADADPPTFTIITPQFTRPTNEPGPASPPADLDAWQALLDAPRQMLKELGLRPWCAVGEDDWPHDRVLMLLPGEWYEHVPEDYPVVDIFGKFESFARGVTDDDIRFGCLSFGVLAVKESEQP